MNSDFAHLLWLFNSPRETRNIIRLDLHEAGLLYKYAKQTWIEPKKLFHHTGKGNTILEIGLCFALNLSRNSTSGTSYMSSPLTNE